MKEIYIVPELEITEVESYDIITTSNPKDDEEWDIGTFSLDPNDPLSFY